jgi:acyl transferase domain-containing protein/pimeloyl-ACP methyl ester carboxylesterase/acyl carrier protein
VSAERKHLDIEGVVRRAIAQETKIPADELAASEPFERYGIESVMSVAIVRRLEETFGELPKTLLFEYETVQLLVAYLQSELGSSPTTPPLSESHAAPTTAPPDLAAATPRQRAGRSEEAAAGDIAIIGISGRLPQSRDLNEFWNNISQGRDCITEIPERLWNWRDYWHPERGAPGRSYSKWGGFIEDSDRFDPLFFGISNAVAEELDPQERLFLETMHHTFEDAGYTRESMRGKRVGLYVSAMWGPYQHYGAADASTDSSFASIANRASYFFDLKGPSIALDTTCSGSLTTLHLACESLRRGETDLAVAGGVNVTSHPHKYLVLSRTGFASTDGRCRSFGAGGNGYVPGDGVGAVLLKPLATAIADGDRIHAIIKATAINHGGRSSGYTVPSADAQATLIESALAKAGIHPRTVTCIEAHAPGTALGDPIEVRALTNAFRKQTADSGFCAIGSVKSNIGHLESAAGFASLAKVVLQLRHRQIAPSIHADTVNPNIRFEDTPFRLQRELAPWPAPVVDCDGDRHRYPRRAGISSFGAGGSNAHVILEEFTAPASHRVPNAEVLIILSAKTEERLRVVIENLLRFVEHGLVPRDADAAADLPIAERILERLSDATRIRAALLDERDRLDDLLPDSRAREAFLSDVQTELGLGRIGDTSTIEDLIAAAAQREGHAAASSGDPQILLEQIAYTLQVGREAMQYRFATLVRSLRELEARLRAHLSGDTALPLTWRDKVPNAAASLAARAEEREYIVRLVASRRHERLGQLWCSGVPVPWTDLYDDPKPARIALPSYPFARERCWVERSAYPATTTSVASDAVERAWIGDGDLRRLVYRERWRPAPVESASAATAPAAATTLLVYPREAAFLAAALKRLLPPGDVFEVILGIRTELLAQQSWEIDVGDERALATCLAHVRRVDTVYFLGAFHSADWQPATESAFDHLQSQSILTLYRLVKVLARPEGEAAPRLKILINHAMSVVDEERIQPYTAAVLGFARGIAREHPELGVKIIDVNIAAEGERSASELIAVLRHAVDGGGSDREIAVRGGRRYIRELHPYDLDATAEPVFRRNGAYVLVGGAGVVGRQLSQYLARSLSARLTWIGRRAMNDEITAQLAKVECLGGRARYVSADAADESQLRAAIDAIVRDDGAIDGVLHLTMLHDVTRIDNLTEEQMRRMIDSKVASTRALHAVLRHHQPGFVALFSSAEAYVGNVGWSAYAGACSFQDAYARHWSQEVPYPVVAVNWGYWEGMPLEVSEMFAANGIHQLPIAAAVSVLERAVASRTTQLIALNVENRVLERMSIMPRAEAEARPQEPHLPIVAPPVRIATRATPAPVVVSALAAAADAPSHERVTSALGDLLSSVLKIERSRIETDVDLLNYGIDSLTVVALHKTLEAKTGALPATLFITLSTLDAVATHLLEQHPAAARALAGVPAPVSANGSNATLLARTSSSGAWPYLEEYGTRYREGRLEQAATPTTLQALATGDGALTHYTIGTRASKRVEVLAAGSGIPVLVLTAVGLTAPTWRHQLVSPLTNRMRFFVPHAPGYGITLPITNCTVTGIAGVMGEVMDVVASDRPVHIVASCLGCVTAMHLARFMPERVASLTLIGAFHDTSDMIVADPAGLTMDELNYVLTTAVEKVKSDFAGVDHQDAANELQLLLRSLCANSLIAMRYLSEMLTMSPLEWLPLITAPTQCIYGTNDRIVATHQSKTIADAIPGAALISIEGAGHFPYLTHSDVINPLIENFVREHESSHVDA